MEKIKYVSQCENGDRYADNYVQIFPDENEKEVLELFDTMKQYIKKYGAASVADLYILLGKLDVPNDIIYTDPLYGWTDSSNFKFESTDVGYKGTKAVVITFPKPHRL